MFTKDDRPTAAELTQLPVLSQGQADNCHYHEGPLKFWVSRTGVADGEPFENTVTIEVYDGNRWEEFATYNGGPLNPEDEEEDQTYEIVRFRQDGPAEVLESGVSLEAAKAHCSADDTSGEGWFDGWRGES